MNTLSKEITLSILGPGGYEALVRRWKEEVRKGHSFSATEHLIYAALRGRDWRRGFAVPHSRRLENGYQWPHEWALAYVHSPHRDAALLAWCGGVLSKEGLARLRELLPKAPSALADSAYRAPVTA